MECSSRGHLERQTFRCLLDIKYLILREAGADLFRHELGTIDYECSRAISPLWKNEEDRLLINVRLKTYKQGSHAAVDSVFMLQQDGFAFSFVFWVFYPGVCQNAICLKDGSARGV